MKAKRERFHNVKELPKEEMLTPGSPMCAGCGGLLSLRLMLNVLGEKTIVVNAAGCLTLLAVYPYVPLRTSWLYTTMGSASAGAQGIRDALDVLIAKGRLPAEEDLKVVVPAGDGATLDLGLSSMSGAIHRGLDFYYLCYDNEGFGNTGFQTSSASAFASQTSTSRACDQHPEGAHLNKKDLFAIWLAHRPPYVATLSVAHPVDLAEKVHRASQFQGPKLFTALATCPTGWGYDPSESLEVAKLAVETGIWALKEAKQGEVQHTYVPSRRKPVEDYLCLQRRYQHLFFPHRREEILQQLQSDVDDYWKEVKARELHVYG